MRILKLSNRNFFLITIFYFCSSVLVFSEDKPIDIWNLEKEDTETILESNITNKNLGNNSKDSIYNIQSNKKKVINFR